MVKLLIACIVCMCMHVCRSVMVEPCQISLVVTVQWCCITSQISALHVSFGATAKYVDVELRNGVISTANVQRWI